MTEYALFLPAREYLWLLVLLAVLIPLPPASRADYPDELDHLQEWE